MNSFKKHKILLILCFIFTILECNIYKGRCLENYYNPLQNFIFESFGRTFSNQKSSISSNDDSIYNKSFPYQQENYTYTDLNSEYNIGDKSVPYIDDYWNSYNDYQNMQHSRKNIDLLQKNDEKNNYQNIYLAGQNFNTNNARIRAGNVIDQTKNEQSSTIDNNYNSQKYLQSSNGNYFKNSETNFKNRYRYAIDRSDKSLDTSVNNRGYGRDIVSLWNRSNVQDENRENENQNKENNEDKVKRLNMFKKIITPVYGNIHETAYYYSDLLVGKNDLSRQSVILDTGSSVLGFPCNSCDSCGNHIDDYYECNSNDTCEVLECSSQCRYCDVSKQRCAYKVSYMEGSSLQGFWHQDYFQFININLDVFDIENLNKIRSKPKYRNRSPAEEKVITLNLNKFDNDALSLSKSIKSFFGCHTKETHLFLKQDASGILGLEPTSTSGPSPFMRQVLLEEYCSVKNKYLSDFELANSPSLQCVPKFKEKRFSLCFSEDGGVMAIGGTNSQYHMKNNKQNANDNFSYNSRYKSNQRELELNKPYNMQNQNTLIVNELFNPSLQFSNINDISSYRNLQPSNINQSYNFNFEYKDTDDYLNENQNNDLRNNSSSNIVWTSVETATQSYAVYLNSVRVAGTEIFPFEDVNYSTAFDDSSNFAYYKINPSIAEKNSMITLIDSGTTLSYVPRKLYNMIIKEISMYLKRGTRQLKQIKVSSVDSKRNIYVDNVTGSYNDTASVYLDDSESETSFDGTNKISQLSNENYMQDIKSKESKTVDDNAINEYEYSEKRKTKKKKRKNTLGKKIDTIKQSAPIRRAKAIKMNSNSQEHCWYLNTDDDLNDFPVIELEFLLPRTLKNDNKKSASNSIFWYPSSYLYKKGSPNYRCLGVLADEVSNSSPLPPLTTQELLQSFISPHIVLGSSFFIQKDIIFDITPGNEVIGFVEASCPVIPQKQRDAISSAY